MNSDVFVKKSSDTTLILTEAPNSKDQVSLLGDELDSIDRNEAHDPFLGCMREDGNTARNKKLRELSQTLEEYGICR